MLGTPRLHLRSTDSTSDRAKELALAGAPHGALVTAAAQTAGRGRQGRRWTTQPGATLAMSLVLRDAPPLLPLVAAVAVAQACGPGAQIKWPNDVLVGGRKVAGILAEGRPQDGWTILGIGVNVAVDPADLPPDLHARAGTLGRARADVAPFLADLLTALDGALALETATLLDEWRARDALAGHAVAWAGGTGTAAGIDGEGRLVVTLPGGGRTALNAGEVHLGRLPDTEPPSR
ncbi:MAG TPA: biotin--[acetyl-CoA-carboxylase] ligase [Baekduia sp.]|uniref:biotin--[acetyl-CoA-carboxylase] ligase n=1 Tax=Baekduia sp. TaxID=2600305 RepID=UPI002C3C737B|nr:biotin--[acetyl-CoA-carboxylase] ligase [Baekduia sp.]HMJ33854.1 biotin--[acetyl-CoA-carboxylase] ligase [Baekduia sp.]